MAAVRGILMKSKLVNIRLEHGISHATLERIADRVRTHIREYVHIKQREIVYGNPDTVEEIEVDEVTVSRYASGDPSKPIAWVGYIGLVARGRPDTLRLIEMPRRCTVLRAPGPGPITIAIWKPLTKSCFRRGCPMVLHTDSARAYSIDIPDVSHTSVVHQLKRINGCWVQP
eukprot:1075445-Amphidinium_carterae.1